MKNSLFPFPDPKQDRYLLYRTDVFKDMSRQEIVQAISNIETAGIPLTDQFIPLNHWNY